MTENSFLAMAKRSYIDSQAYTRNFDVSKHTQQQRFISVHCIKCVVLAAFYT